MSRSVSGLDKALRIVGFSVYLAFIVSFFFLFFKGLNFSLGVFMASTAYFILIFVALTISKHIHFNVILRRRDLKKSLFNSHYPIAKFKILIVLMWIAIVLLAVMAGFYFYNGLPVHAIALAIIAVFAFFYAHIHKIGIHVLKEGIAFDYGQLIVLLQWNEIRRISMKGNYAIVELKEKEHIKRRFHVANPEGFRKVVRKFGF